MNREDLGHLREDYNKGELLETNVHPNPIQQFQNWFDEAVKSEIKEPNAFCLSTINKTGGISSRIVLLKEIRENEGFIFYTNYNSDKGIEMSNNPNIAANFLWLPLERQVRIEGHVSKISPSDSDAYFIARPRGSQIGAIASDQSKETTREDLELKYKEIEALYQGKDIPRPNHWGGIIIIPKMIEFWQGRSSRLHDRLRYELDSSNNWTIKRLSP
jgi:pyridoxamine 5'-phosphate oxidase